MTAKYHCRGVLMHNYNVKRIHTDLRTAHISPVVLLPRLALVCILVRPLFTNTYTRYIRPLFTNTYAHNFARTLNLARGWESLGWCSSSGLPQIARR